MIEATIDFETRSVVPIRTDGLSKYARDPSTRVLCMSWAIDDGPVHLWRPGQPFPPEVLNADFIHAHNAPFEIYTLKHVLNIDIPIEKFRCSAMRCSYAGLPRSLEAAGTAIGLPANQAKDKRGKELIQLLSIPRKDGTFNDDPGLIHEYEEYCRQDTVAERALEHLLPEVPDDEWKNWRVDRIINGRGVPVDRKLCEGAIAIMDEATSQSMSIADALSGGTIRTGGQVAKIKEFVNERGLNIQDLQEETVAWAIENTTNEDVIAMLHLRQSVSSAAAKKYPSVLSRVDSDGRLRECYLHYGAHTGRKSSPGVQIQNLKKGFDLHPSVMDAIKMGDMKLLEAMFKQAPISILGQAVRGFVCAPEGDKLLFADFSQIEVRIAHWLANNEKMLRVFREGGDPYITFSKSFFHTTTVSKEQRQYSKPIVLGGNYGMGAIRLISYAEQYGVKLTHAQAEKTIKFYRADNQAIVNYWRAVEQAPVRAVLTGKPVRLGPLVFQVEGQWLTLRLPSLRKLYYYKPELHDDKYGPYFTYVNTRGVREKLWGGTWLENLCQAISRDLTALTEYRCEESDLPVIIDQHDEVGVEILESKADAGLEKLLGIMREVPMWCKTLPIDADGRIRQRFEK